MSDNEFRGLYRLYGLYMVARNSVERIFESSQTTRKNRKRSIA
jgi:hypothetical protein